MAENVCPKCGSRKAEWPLVAYTCGSVSIGGECTQSWQCKCGVLYRQLAAARARVEALEAGLRMVLLFHGVGGWDSEKRLSWANLTGGQPATTKALCDKLRALLDYALKAQEGGDGK